MSTLPALLAKLDTLGLMPDTKALVEAVRQEMAAPPPAGALTADYFRRDNDPKRSRFTIGAHVRLPSETVMITSGKWRDDIGAWVYDYKGNVHDAPQFLGGLVDLTPDEWMAIGRSQVAPAGALHPLLDAATEVLCAYSDGGISIDVLIGKMNALQVAVAQVAAAPPALSAEERPVVDVLVSKGLAPSRSVARQLIMQGAVWVNGETCEDVSRVVHTAEDEVGMAAPAEGPANTVMPDGYVRVSTERSECHLLRSDAWDSGAGGRTLCGAVYILPERDHRGPRKGKPYCDKCFALAVTATARAPVTPTSGSRDHVVGGPYCTGCGWINGHGDGCPNAPEPAKATVRGKKEDGYTLDEVDTPEPATVEPAPCIGCGLTGGHYGSCPIYERSLLDRPAPPPARPPAVTRTIRSRVIKLACDMWNAEENPNETDKGAEALRLVQSLLHVLDEDEARPAVTREEFDVLVRWVREGLNNTILRVDQTDRDRFVFEMGQAEARRDADRQAGGGGE